MNQLIETFYLYISGQFIKVVHSGNSHLSENNKFILPQLIEQDIKAGRKSYFYQYANFTAGINWQII